MMDSDRGFRVYVVPEASTLLQTGGAFFLYVVCDDYALFDGRLTGESHADTWSLAV